MLRMLLAAMTAHRGSRLRRRGSGAGLEGEVPGAGLRHHSGRERAEHLGALGSDD